MSLILNSVDPITLTEADAENVKTLAHKVVFTEPKY